jgi:hypothetical protein
MLLNYQVNNGFYDSVQHLGHEYKPGDQQDNSPFGGVQTQNDADYYHVDGS